MQRNLRRQIIWRSRLLRDPSRLARLVDAVIIEQPQGEFAGDGGQVPAFAQLLQGAKFFLQQPE